MKARTRLSPFLLICSFASGCADDSEEEKETSSMIRSNNPEPDAGGDDGDDTDGDDTDSTAEGPDAGISAQSESDVDFTRCRELDTSECDPDGDLDFDFTGMWIESFEFTSNDCDRSVQDLIPDDFEQEVRIDDVIVGHCMLSHPDGSEFTGSIAPDLAGATYCAETTEEVEGQEGGIELVNHTTWKSIDEDKITGESVLYAVPLGCSIVADYSLTRVVVDYASCETLSASECDPDADLDFDFSGEWTEQIEFESNDCPSAIQSLLPSNSEQEGLEIEDLISGTCVHPSSNGESFGGSIDTALESASYCYESSSGGADVVNHVKWQSIDDDEITGVTHVYISAFDCTLVGSYALTRDD